jgi:DNA-binding transcriptional ArsR family regulator
MGRSLTGDYLVTYSSPVTDDDHVFKALADPTRRLLLDRLYEREGRTLTELESEIEMTRFGVMKHLPIRLIHDRWIDKYTERHVSALADLKHKLEETA